MPKPLNKPETPEDAPAREVGASAPVPVPIPVSKPVAAKSADKPVDKPADVPKKVKPHYVRIENKLKQVLVLSVINDDGRAEELRLLPRTTSPALREDRLTDVIRRFVADGKVRIR